jgi:2-polyprenyl-6-hydroxyphenyl methylase/3-demethylubiquinone-9 3-methyltransferase
MLSKFIFFNQTLSQNFDRLLPKKLRKDGNGTFLREILPSAVGRGDIVYDLGSGSQPYFSPEGKEKIGAIVVGLDIDSAELAGAETGSYDRTIVHDLCTFEGVADANVVICQATLEHVPDTTGAIRAITSTLAPGGRAFIFAPCRNAAFARLNIILPEALKRKILFSLFPSKAEGHDGFKAYYDKCTPSAIERLARENGLEVDERHVFWMSSYFTIFFPAFVAWRLTQLISWLILRDDAAETFIFVLRKPAYSRREKEQNSSEPTFPKWPAV